MHSSHRRIPPKALTIAGSDSGGGAGVQADIKTFAALGVYGASVITSLTAQNSLGVSAIHVPPPDFIFAQMAAVMSDIGADAAKTGMLANAGAAEAVDRALERWPVPALVIDPVMVATSGAVLLEEEAVTVYRRRLFAKALVITPNLAEARALTGMEVRTLRDMEEAARALKAMGPRNVLIKGGHLEEGIGSPDVLFDGVEFTIFEARRIDSENTHGSGCTLSAAMAALLARGLGLKEAVAGAKRFVGRAIEASYRVGAGQGPLNHGYAVDPPV